MDIPQIVEDNVDLRAFEDEHDLTGRQVDHVPIEPSLIGIEWRPVRE
jgi:hypothetical protein